MIKKLIRWLFKKEYAKVQTLINKAKEYDNIRFVKYEVFDMATEKFLFPIQSIIKSDVFLYWLLERKRQYEELVKYGTVANRENNLGRAMAMDEMLRDCETFKNAFTDILTSKTKVAEDDE